jgi:hypothetical protein
VEARGVPVRKQTRKSFYECSLRYNFAQARSLRQDSVTLAQLFPIGCTNREIGSLISRARTSAYRLGTSGRATRILQLMRNWQLSFFHVVDWVMGPDWLFSLFNNDSSAERLKKTSYFSLRALPNSCYQLMDNIFIDVRNYQ